MTRQTINNIVTSWDMVSSANKQAPYMGLKGGIPIYGYILMMTPAIYGPKRMCSNCPEPYGLSCAYMGPNDLKLVARSGIDWYCGGRH